MKCKKQLKIKILIFILLFFITAISINKVNATEELPNNGARISSAQVIQTKTGTGPWDDNDEPGNDSGEDNNIVRSFDQVTWTIENTFVLNDHSSNSYTGGRIYFEATLPDVFTSKTIEWDLDSMEWIENVKVSENGLTISGYYQMSNIGITVPGKQSLIFVAKLYGAANGIEFQPTIKTWLMGNNEDNYVVTIPEKTIVSAAPRYNVVLLRNGNLANKVTVDYGEGDVSGRMYGYGLGLQLYNTDVSKGLKGIEYPKGDITFDIDLKLERSTFSGSITLEDITDECTPILWNYKVNVSNLTPDAPISGNIVGRPMSWGNQYHRYNYGLPYGIKTELRKDSVYNSGNIKMIQNGSKISVTISDYSFDGEFPIYQYDYNGAPHTSIQYTSNIGYFNTSYFQIFVPDKEATIIEDRNYYLTVSDSNFLSTSVSNNVTNNQVIASDDSNKIQHVIYKKGTYTHNISIRGLNGKLLSSTGMTGDGYAYIGQSIEIMTKFNISVANDYDIYTAEKFVKFDGDLIEPTTYSDGKKYKVRSFHGSMRFNVYYVTKPDGTNWSSQQEMNNADIEDMIVYENMEDIPEGDICIGVFYESIDGNLAVSSGDNNYTYFPAKIKDTATIGQTYGLTQSTKMWIDTIDRSIYNIKNKGIEYPKETWKAEHQNYIKTEYDENGEIISGTHNGGCVYGQTILVVGANQGITLETIDNNGYNKVNYDLGKNENTVTYKITPSLTNPDVTKVPNISGVTVTITDTLPNRLTYVPGSSNYGDPEITENDNGTTTLVWKIYNCTVGEKIEPITFDANIYAETSNGIQYENIAVISADNDLIGNTIITKRTATNTIQITNLSSHRLYKTMNTPVIEKNGEIHFTLSYKNNTDETIPDFQLLDILPYNGDTRGTNYTGTYTLDRIMVIQEDGNGNKLANNNLQILYTNDEESRNVTSKDENLGLGWNTVISENIKQNATAIAVKGEVGAQGKVTIDVYLKTENNKGLDKYVNSATAQVYKATEEITTSNVVSQVVERKIEGIAWEDVNANGVKDDGEEVLKNIELSLTDSLGNQVTDVNGNKVSSVRTDEKGYYKFENLPKGKYYIQVVVFDSSYGITEKEIGTNSKINSKFNIEARETDEITKLDSIDLPEITVSNVNVGFVKKVTSIIVKHQTEEGVDLVEPEILNGRIDDEYETDKKEFEEYEIKVVPENAKGTMQEEQIEVVYVYSLVKGKITITKVDKKDNTKYLSGATFKIEKLTEDDTIDENFTVIEKTTEGKGIAEFTELLVGKYRITETKAPEGYELSKNAIEVEITKDLKEQNIIATDRLKLKLPVTGGMGKVIFTIIGISLIIIARFIIKNKVNN